MKSFHLPPVRKNFVENDELELQFIENVKNGDYKKVVEAFEEGINMNFQDKDHKTALIWASTHGYKEIISLLISKRCDLDIRDDYEETAVVVCIRLNHVECLNMLLDAGAKIDLRTDRYSSPMVESVLSQKPDCLRVLLSHGGRANFKVKQTGCRLIHLCAKHEIASCMEILLQYGAQVNLKDNNNKLPIDYLPKDSPLIKTLSDYELKRSGETQTSLTDYATPCSPEIGENEEQWDSGDDDNSDSDGSSFDEIPNTPVSQEVICGDGYMSLNSEHSAGTQTDASCSQSPKKPSQPNHLKRSSPTLNSPPNKKRILTRTNSFSACSQALPVTSDGWEMTVDGSCLKLKKEIGRGNYGKVYKARWQQSTSVAVKVLKSIQTDEIPKSITNSFRYELESLMNLRHPNIILFLGGSCDHEEPFIVTEFLKKGSLHKLLHEDHYLPSYLQRLQMALDVSRGMHYLVSHTPEPIIHRDLKATNILVTDSYRLKVADMGLARVKGEENKHVNPTDICIQAPEVLKTKGCAYSEKSDVWSFGLVLWELFTLQIPYSDKTPKQIADYVMQNGRMLELDGNLCPSNYKTLYEFCCSQDPADRPSFLKISKKLKKLIYTEKHGSSKIEDTGTQYARRQSYYLSLNTSKSISESQTFEDTTFWDNIDPDIIVKQHQKSVQSIVK